MKTKDKILLGAKNHLLKHGQGSFTIRAIAKEANVNPGLIHHYFGSKENLVLSLVETESNNVLQYIKNSLEHAVVENEADAETIRSSMIENFLTNTVAIKLFTEAIFLTDNSPALKERMKKFAASRREVITSLLGINDPVGEIIFQAGVLGMILLNKLDDSIDLETVLKTLYETTRNISIPEGDK